MAGVEAVAREEAARLREAEAGDRARAAESARSLAEARAKAAEELSASTAQVRRTVGKLVLAEESLESSLTCMRCMSLLRDPVALWPCGHVVCRECGPEDGGECSECGTGVKAAVPIEPLDVVASRHAYKVSQLRDIEAYVKKVEEALDAVA